MNKEKIKGLLEVSCCTYHDELCAEIYDYVINLQQENQQLKKQKDDVVEYIKNNWYSKNTRDINEFVIGDWRIDILRMLGEIDVED